MNKKLKNKIDVTIKQNNVAKDMFIKKCDNCIKLQKKIDKALDYIEGFIEYDEKTKIVSTPYSFDGYDLGKIWRILKGVDNE